MHDKFFWNRKLYTVQTQEAIAEAKRTSIYSFVPPMVKDPPPETPKQEAAANATVGEAKEAAEKAEERFEELPKEEKKDAEKLAYPEAKGAKSGIGYVKALVGEILNDKSLDRSSRIHRLTGVIAHNGSAHWAPQEDVNRIVKNAISWVEAHEK